MNPHTTRIDVITLVLLSAGIYQIIAGLLAGLFWLTREGWTRLIPHIAFIAFWLTVPGAYLVWKKFNRYL